MTFIKVHGSLTDKPRLINVDLVTEIVAEEHGCCLTFNPSYNIRIKESLEEVQKMILYSRSAK